jgi:HSP20 family protein
MAEINEEKKRLEERDRQGWQQLERRQDGGLSNASDFGTSPLFWRSPRDYFATNPFALMRRLGEEMGRAFSSTQFGGGAGEIDGWSPAIEITEREGKMIVHADLPGINKDDVKVEVTQDTLTIQGERKREHEEQRRGFHRCERSYGSFYRSIPLPAGANPDAVRAQFNNGVLEVLIPVPEEQRKRRQIPIESGSGERKEAQSQISGQKQESKAG